MVNERFQLKAFPHFVLSLTYPAPDVSLPRTPSNLIHAVGLLYLSFEVRCGGRQGFVPRQRVVPKPLLLGSPDSLLGITPGIATTYTLER